MSDSQIFYLDVSENMMTEYLYTTQNDIGRKQIFIVQDAGVPVALTGYTVDFVIKRSDGTNITPKVSTSGNIITLSETALVTSLDGLHDFELVITDPSGDIIASWYGYYVVAPIVVKHQKLVDEYKDNLIDFLITEFANLSVQMKAIQGVIDNLILKNGGDLATTVVNFNSYDTTDGTPDKWLTVPPLESSKTMVELMERISAMTRNARYMFKLLSSFDVKYDPDAEDISVSYIETDTDTYGGI